MREHRLTLVFGQCTAYEGALLLERILLSVRRHRSLVYPGFVTLFKVVVRWEQAQDSRLSRWLQAAVEQELFWAAAFLSRPLEAAQEDRVRVLDPDLAALTLGARKASLRKVMSEKELEKYFPFDHPHIIEILLSQPRMSEKLVVRYVAQRPIPVQVALAICLHARWIHSAQVLAAMVLNPTLPQWLALKLLPVCSDDLLTEVMQGQGEGRKDLYMWALRLREGVS